MNYKEMIKKVVEVNIVKASEETIREAIELHRNNIRRIPRLPHIISPNKTYESFTIKSKTNEFIILVKESPEKVEIELNHAYFTYSEILRELLPEGITPPSSFETIGSIIHLNLSEQQLEYKDIIGKVIHDKTNKVVITKVGNISSVYRYYDLEVIGGDYTPAKITAADNLKILEEFKEDVFSDLTTIHIENRIRFFIDLRNVYWCSKLQGERFELLKQLKKGETLCDVFCGVGPVSIPSIKKGCLVYANDLNPVAGRCFKKTIELNNLGESFYKLYNLDAAEFLEEMSNIQIDHFFLNLPEHSLSYLKQISKHRGSFLVHCYFFCSSSVDVAEFVCENTGLMFEKHCYRIIRKVSPSKDMYKLEVSSTELTGMRCLEKDKV